MEIATDLKVTVFKLLKALIKSWGMLPSQILDFL
jgi:hypothetical protein